MKKYRLKCKVCGSTNIIKDAWAEWDEENQKWILSSVYDHVYCTNCEGETKILENNLK